jgi:pimeloyl-ACP methyl ester carboxylesterase
MGVVLVHGSFVDGSLWAPVADRLRGGGHRVEVVELHRGSLDGDTRAAQAAVDAVGGPVVVCGWSYGGMVITGLDLPLGSHLVYLCALMPDEGESAISLGSEHPGGIDSILGADDAGELVLAGEDLDQVLWGDADADMAEKARAALRSQSMQSFLDTPSTIAWRDTPSTYVVGRHDCVFHPDLVKEMSGRATTAVEWDTSHSPNLSRPELVADLLSGLDPADA